MWGPLFYGLCLGYVRPPIINKKNSIERWDFLHNSQIKYMFPPTQSIILPTPLMIVDKFPLWPWNLMLVWMRRSNHYEQPVFLSPASKFRNWQLIPDCVVLRFTVSFLKKIKGWWRQQISMKHFVPRKYQIYKNKLTPLYCLYCLSQRVSVNRITPESGLSRQFVWGH